MMLTKTRDAQVESPVGASKPMTMIQALRSAMDVMMERDDNVVVFGQDVGYFGGVFRVTEGLQAKYGKSRCFDAPISEGGIVGVAVGMGAYGLRPVAEIQFADYFYPASGWSCSASARFPSTCRAWAKRRSRARMRQPSSPATCASRPTASRACCCRATTSRWPS